MSAAAFVGIYRSQDGCRTVVVLPGRKLLTLIGIDAGVRMDRVAKTEARYIRARPEYPVRRAARYMLRAGAHIGCSKRAKRLLKALLGVAS